MSVILRPHVPPFAGTRAAPLDTSAPWEPADSGGLLVLSLRAGGVFTRASEGSRLVSAPTDGSIAFLAWSGNDVRRIEERGDGLGSCLLLEGARTNYVVRNRDFSAFWSPDGGTFTAGQPSPDGAAAAYRHQVPSASLGDYQQTVGMPTTGYHCVSQWIRSYAGVVTGRFSAWEASGTANLGMTGSIDQIYRRWDMQYAALSQMWIAPSSARAMNGGAIAAGAADQIPDLVQVEAAPFPSSAIRTGASSATRAADILTYATGSYPTSFLASGFRVVVALDASSAEIIAAGADMRIVQVGANDYLRVRASAGSCVVDLVCGGVVVATRTVTFARGQALTTTPRPAAGSLTVSGATTGDGTATGSGAAWASASTLYVGADNAGSNNMFGRLVGAQIVGA